MDSERNPGDRVGACELVRLLGVGGMGEVWEAVLHGPAGFRKEVAVKLLHASPSEQDRALLVREARLGARLQHPNVVGVLGLGEVDGAWHVVMELVRGPSIAQLVREGPLAPSLVLDVGAQAASGLAHIHGLVVDDRPAGLVHCDIKPENLLLDEYGVVKLADLGIAALGGERHLAAGTLGYMAPEQVDGRPEARSDLFALGATLYVLATGARPFERSLRALAGLDRRLDDPAFAADVDARVPGLGAVVARCLRSEPAQRYASAVELYRAVAALRASGSTTLPPSEAPTVRLGPASPSTPTARFDTPRARSGASRGSVARPRDRFVGRAAELAAVASRLRAGDRLVSLVATGGSGKTRLATEVALVLAGELPGGAWWFDLADARTVDDVCAAMASQLGAPLGRADPVAQVAAALAARGPALAVLDNLEQCVDAARALVPRLLDLSPDTQLLCTSRTPLKVRGERPVPVDALPIDDAVALFRDRAPVPVPDAHHDELRALCAELGGLPLAIELAAARGRTMSVPTMRQRLGLRLLAGGGAELPDRHRSLEASIRWSWDLLSEPARHALCQLSVFVGGCSLAAAEAVLDERALGPDGWALDRLQELSEASLLRVEPESDRVSLLSVVQAFAAARSTPADRDAAEARHAAFFAQLGAPGAVQRLVARTVAPDAENLVAAARSAIRRGDVAVVPPLLAAALAVLDRVGAPGTADELVRDAIAVPGLAAGDRGALAASGARSALVTGRPEEAARHLATAEAALAGATEPAVVGQLAWTRALAHRFEGRHDAAAAAYDEALAALERVGDPSLSARVISSRGGLASELGQVDEAAGWFERSLRLRRAAGDRLGEAMDRANLANLALARRQPAEALAHQQAALAGYRETGDARGEAQLTGDLGLSLQGLGQSADAERHYRTALALHRRAGNRRFEGIVMSNLASLLLEAGRHDEAERVVRGALELHRQTHNRRSEGIAGEVLAKVLAAVGRRDEAVAAAREALACHVAARNPRWERTTRELLATWGASDP